LKRRKFILRIAGAGGAVAGLGAVFFSTSPLKGSIERKIQGELSFLRLDPEGLSRFAADYTRRMTPRGKKALVGYSFLRFPSRYSQKIRRLLNVYLLSTDFFQNKMDESRTIRYIALYDPQFRPCVNPFSGGHYPMEGSEDT
jgi:hypothetical protein